MSRNAEERASRLAELRLAALRKLVDSRFGLPVDPTKAIEVLARASVADVLRAVDERVNPRVDPANSGAPIIRPLGREVVPPVVTSSDVIVEPTRPSAAEPDRPPSRTDWENTANMLEDPSRQVRLDSMVVFPPAQSKRPFRMIAPLVIGSAAVASLVYWWDVLIEWIR